MALLLFLLILVAGAMGLGMKRASGRVWATAAAVALFLWQAGVFRGQFHFPAPGVLGLLAWLIPVGLFLLTVPQIRRRFLIEPAFERLKPILPKISDTEQEALEAGTVGFDAELFSGEPDWDKLRSIAPIVLTPE